MGQDWRPRLRLEGYNTPRVNVIVTACRESLGVIQDTVLGALNIDYPVDNFRVVISDDGDDQALRLWAEKISRKHPNLYYTSRASKNRVGHKAGNLNHALRYMDDVPGPSTDFVAGLDADMIPERHWLRSVMAHLVLDEKLGLVCPSQVGGILNSTWYTFSEHLSYSSAVLQCTRKRSVASGTDNLLGRQRHCARPHWLRMEHGFGLGNA